MGKENFSSPGVQSWYGNIAKMRVISRILETPGKKTIFDYGAGAGGGWPGTLAQHPEIQLVAYEPSPSSNSLRQRTPQAVILGAEELAGDSVGADFIVSFSVFEHVYDRAAYLANARRHLADGGTFFLNYDDAHFRKSLDLNRPRSWFGDLREYTKNAGAGIWPHLGMIGRYQSRVVREDADAMVAAAGFATVSVRYENIVSFKRLSKHVPKHGQAEFSALWLATEDSLNSEHQHSGSLHYGDEIILWREMGSRTLELQAL